MKGVDPIKKRFWPPDSRVISNLIVVLIGILFYVALNNLNALRWHLSVFLDVIAPFVAGFAIAYLLNTPVTFFEYRVFKKIKWSRALAITTVYLLAVVALAVLLNMILPQVVSSVMALVGNMQGYWNNLSALVDDLVVYFNLEGEGIDNLMLSYQDLVNTAADFITSAMPKLFNFGMALGSGVVAALTALISSVYMLAGKDTLKTQLKGALFALFPVKKAEHFLQTCRRANEIFLGFINGKIIDSAIIGVLCFLLCSIFRIPFALLISVVVGVTNIIPFFGPIVGAIPSVMILIIVDPWAALRFGILIIALQQFDGNILGPKILGDSTGLSAIWVLVAIVVGGGLFGFIGMLLGVPTFAVIYMLSRDFVEARLAAKRIDKEGKPLAPAENAQEEEKNNGRSKLRLKISRSFPAPTRFDRE